jgi:nucleoside diphosphate-linked moiety X motif protein 19
MSIPWKEASSVIIAAKCTDAPTVRSTTDYRILLTRRSGKSSYLANTYCFPGGHIDIADFESPWWRVFSMCGYSREELRKSLLQSENVPRPPILVGPKILETESKAKDFLWPEIALKISAIRETFEETGILIARGKKGSSITSTQSYDSLAAKVDLRDWQKRVHVDASVFHELLSELEMCPDVWCLKEWWNWLTPPTVGHKRFDTMFYVACLDHIPKVNSDQNEVSQISWLTPKQLLSDHLKGKSFLAPPQVYELARLGNFDSLSDLRTFASDREALGIERWCANVTGLADGALLALPRDECFNLTIDSSQLPTLDQMKRDVMNRMELRAPVFLPVCKNVTFPCGHVAPITMDPSSTSGLEDSAEYTSARIASNL